MGYGIVVSYLLRLDLSGFKYSSIFCVYLVILVFDLLSIFNLWDIWITTNRTSTIADAKIVLKLDKLLGLPPLSAFKTDKIYSCLKGLYIEGFVFREHALLHYLPVNI